MENLFLKAMGVKDTVTENGAISNSSTGKAITDQFGTTGNYRDRNYDEVSAEQELLWRENPLMAIRFPFYLRMITRKVIVNDKYKTKTIQKGQGARDESFKRLLSIAEYHSKEFYRNIWLLPIIGSWKDLWTLMFYDEEMGLYLLDRKIIYALIEKGMGMKEHVDLIKKFMPRIKSSSKTKTNWTKKTNKYAKEFADFLGWNYYQYNKFKSTGKAHEFQRLMCSKNVKDIDWNTIPGRALSNLVHSKFIENHDLLSSYKAWLNLQENIKFNGYVYELAKHAWNHTSDAEDITIDKQFDTLIRKVKAENTITENVLCALDTSGSMNWEISNTGVRAIDICLSLGIYFSALNQGAFNNSVLMFDVKSRFKTLNGSFTEKIKSIKSETTAWGNTDFQSIIDAIIDVRRKNKSIPIDEYPKTILVVSDMEFDSVGSTETNYEAMKRKLYDYFPSEFVDSMKFIWWNVSDKTKNFPTRISDSGTYFLSGFDGSVINLLLGSEYKKDNKKTISMEELVESALTQEILQEIKID